MRHTVGPIALLLVACLSVVSTASAQEEDQGPASLTVCNKGTRAVNVALGAHDFDPIAPTLQVVAWQTVKPGACGDVYDFQRTVYIPLPAYLAFAFLGPQGQDDPGSRRDNPRHRSVDVPVDSDGPSLPVRKRAGADASDSAALRRRGASRILDPVRFQGELRQSASAGRAGHAVANHGAESSSIRPRGRASKPWQAPHAAAAATISTWRRKPATSSSMRRTVTTTPTSR